MSPSGHGSTAPGTAAVRSATWTSHPTAGPASQAHACAGAEPSGESTAASTPSTVAGATAGTASRLATTAIGLTSPLSPATSGAVTRNAAAGTASASAAHVGTPRRRKASVHPGARSTRAAVASTDSANPRVDGQRRIHQQQHQHGHGQRRERGTAPPQRQCEQHHCAHRGGAHHARRRAGKHHEPGDRRGAQRCCEPRVGSQQPQQGQHRAPDDGEVRPGHGQQVGETRRPEVGLHLGGETGGVADRQPGEQPGRCGRQHGGGGLA